MALIAHWPLIGNTDDYSGNNNHLIYYNNNGKIVQTSNGKIGSAYERQAERNGNDWLGSTNDVDLQGDFTFAIWVKATDLHNGTANGILTNHNHANDTGAGITLKHISDTDFRISANTGNGSSRTYHSYYGNTNIYNRWAHLVLRFTKATNMFSFYVDGVKDRTDVNYAQYNIAQKIGLFSWSLGFNGSTSYRPAVIMNDARVYDHALSEYEIKELAKAKIGHWRFDSDNLDSSGYQNHATNAGTISTDTKIGIGSLLVAQNTISTGITDIIYKESFSASIWFKLTGNDLTQNAGTSRSVFGNWSNYHGFMFYRNNGDSNNRYRFYLNYRNTSNGRGTVSRNQSLIIDTWYHLGMAAGPNGEYAFVLNGQVVQSGIVSSFKSWEGADPENNNAPFYIGRNNSYGPIEGYVDDCQLYMTYLTSDDFQSIYKKRANFDNLGNVSVGELYEGTDETLIQNGMIFYLDPANPACFTPGDSIAYNLITGGTVQGASGTPSSGTNSPAPSNMPVFNRINGGVFDFNGGKGMNVDENLGSHSEISICMWFYKKSSSGEYFTDARNNGGQWFLSNYSSDNINYTEALTYNFGGSYNSSNSEFLNNWHFMVVTSNSSGSKLGVEVSGGNRNSIDEDLGKNFRIGTRYTTSSQWDGYMGPIMIYDRVLSSSEVVQNYNTHKDRFVSDFYNKEFTAQSVAKFLSIDEVTGTQNANTQQEITKNGTLLINGEFSEVD